jgi:hypothetical protein
MNPEIQYPELKEMKSGEIFIEWAYIVRFTGILKLYLRKIISKKEQNTFIRALKTEYNVQSSENLIKDERVELVTIEK